MALKAPCDVGDERRRTRARSESSQPAPCERAERQQRGQSRRRWTVGQDAVAPNSKAERKKMPEGAPSDSEVVSGKGAKCLQGDVINPRVLTEEDQ